MPKASDLLFEGNIKHLHKLSRQTFSLSFISPRKVTLYSFKFFANLSNFVALLGGSIKKNQSISGDMADILSNLYLAHSIVWYENKNNVSSFMKDYCIKRLMYENSSIRMQRHV